MRILVVEDQPVLCAQFARALRLESYAVDSASDGEEALFKLLHGAYDAVLLDINLPKLDGFAVVEQMRAKGSTIPVMFLTARDTIQDRVKGLDLGADDYLVKGFDMRELKARMRALLRRHAQMARNLIQVGEVRLDLATKQVERGGETVKLTAREYGIVATLMRRLNAVVSREELYESVIDEVDDSMSNLLDVHVCSIRKKLGADFIQTIRGRGYTVVSNDPT